MEALEMPSGAIVRRIERVVWKVVQIVGYTPNVYLTRQFCSLPVTRQDRFAYAAVFAKPLSFGNWIELAELNSQEMNMHAGHHPHQLVVPANLYKFAIEDVSGSEKLQRVGLLFE
jgi:hypothetical protein